MGKKIKMVLYGEPGVGKSVFASKAPHPFFVTTDGNYEWLEDFGAKEEDHIQSTSWAMTKKIIIDIRDNPEKYEKYETLVMDLLEDNFKWCEYEYCASKGVEHISEAGGYGKGYDVIDIAPRPFMQNTHDDLERNHYHTEAMKRSLKKQGLEVK